MRKRTIYAFVLIALLGALILLAIVLNTRQKAIPVLPTRVPTATPAPTVSPAPTATPAPTVTPAPTAAPLQSERFELPIQGATGFTSISMNLRAAASSDSALLATLSPGTAFVIRAEAGNWLHVRVSGTDGYLYARYCLINLPDIVPSIVYDATNTYGSILHSSGKAIPGITGEGLYPGKQKNARLGTKEFIMPVLYAMAEKIYAAQKAALKNGETLVLYEAYRPYEVQMTIVRALKELAKTDKTVMAGISSAPWALSWFASTRLSNHQRGGAVDISLAKVTATAEKRVGAYGYTDVTDARRYDMPTEMHELSQKAATFTAPVSGSSRTAWKSATFSARMNAPAKRLQKYMTDAGLTPLASEWWHFNDLDALEMTSTTKSTGRYVLSGVVSEVP